MKRWVFFFLLFFIISYVWGEELKKEEVIKWMKELAEYVEKNHLKKKENSPQFGMVYEYVNTKKIGQLGQWVQGEALDTMHDGAWFTASICQAYRATGDKYYFNLLSSYLIPFYTKVLNNSDTLFKDGLDPEKIAPSKSKSDLEHKYLGGKGFCPYWWDDGDSQSIEGINQGIHGSECVDYFLLNNQPNPENRLWGFSLGCSNHMAQDLAVMLIETYLLTKKPEVLLAATYLQEDRSKRNYPYIPVIVASASFKDETLLGKIVDYSSKLEPSGWYYNILYNYEKDRTYSAPSFADDDEYIFYSNIIKYRGKVQEGLAFLIIYRAFTNPFLFRYWWDIGNVEHGLNVFDLSGMIKIKNGKCLKYRSDFKEGMWYGSRMGPQNLKVTGWALQLIDSFPGIWEKRYKEKFKDDILVRFKEGFKVDCEKEEFYSESINIEGLKINFGADRRNLYIYGEKEKDNDEFILFSKPDGGGNWVKVKIGKEIDIENLKGEKVINEYKLNGNKFEIRIPYQICKEQKEFLTGVEHGRYSCKVGDKIVNLYFMSSERDVKEELLKELTEGIITWKKIFKEKGYIPTGIGSSSISSPVVKCAWEDLSDTGGYAHLIGACSQYLFYLERKKYWEELKISEIFNK